MDWERPVKSLGIDLGIASCGWALIETDVAQGRIIACGARTFDAPETDKERTPTNQLRRQFRGMRRVIRRRRQRMAQLRLLFQQNGLLPNAKRDALRLPGLDPWQLRVAALDRRLTPEELAVTLGHIARHRGFRSNKKNQGNEAGDDGRVLKAAAANQEILAKYRSVAEMFAKDERFARRKRNRDGEYTQSVNRIDLEHETRLIFSRQRALGSSLAGADFQEDFAKLAFDQRPLADSDHLVGFCPFEPKEKRAAKRAYSFEVFRFLSRLNALRIGDARQERPLSEAELAAAMDGFGSQRGMTFARLRKLIGLPDGDAFRDVPRDEEGSRDVVNRSAGNGCMQGSATLRAALGEHNWKTLLQRPEKLDEIAFIITFRATPESIEKGLFEAGLDPDMVHAIMAAVEKGSFAAFTGAGHVSAKACRAIIPGLQRGLVYSEACAAVGYDHAARPVTEIASINNPVARRALGEALKQVKAIITAHGKPDRIHIEMARDVGKSKEERDKITSGFEKRNKERDKLRASFAETVGAEPSSAEDMLRFELWTEQRGWCLYTNQAIPPGAIRAKDNSVQVDHILPWSRFGDDSFINKTLCFAKANQEKKGRTPFEWLKDEPERWAKFVACVETNKGMKGRKKRNYLLRDAQAVEERFRTRNLNDTRYACRILMEHLARLYPDDKRYVLARPGALTDRLRRGWGLQGLKKVLEPDGERRKHDDRHHALDAIIVAATSESALQLLTSAFKEAEDRGSHRDFADFPPPWPSFIEDVRRHFREILVSRAERGRARGEAHAATISQLKQTDDGPLIYERKAVDKLTLKDLERVKDPDRNAALIAAMRAWIEAGKPKNAPPLSPKGDPIRKIRLITTDKPAVPVRGGNAERGEMVRVDVFRKANKRGVFEYFLVPIYPHQVADKANWPTPPNRAARGATPEDQWPEITAEHEFIFSVGPRTFLEVEKRDGTIIDGYFMGMDRSTAAIHLSAPHSTRVLIRSIGVLGLKRFEKWRVDRLGNRHAVGQEKRTWHGVVCT
ncbi:MAG: type II CRISPR RNA-guided endonuclease Cas9 [Roseomonas sp.]|nr:type II CRISPR RNA-guided endonuclease Cas9 [Roseomonas sp.]MCA3300130.1 type II CRISPR RNA-guided endonuclease Cas9 [Roseomonas sp.]